MLNTMESFFFFNKMAKKSEEQESIRFTQGLPSARFSLKVTGRPDLVLLPLFTPMTCPILFNFNVSCFWSLRVQVEFKFRASWPLAFQWIVFLESLFIMVVHTGHNDTTLEGLKGVETGENAPRIRCAVQKQPRSLPSELETQYLPSQNLKLYH